MFERQDDTIAAISSPPGRSPRGVLRMSGPRAIEWTASLFAPQDGASLENMPGFRVVAGHVQLEANDSQTTLPATVYLFRAPASYTRQDIVEIHVPGGAAVTAVILDRCRELGARQAEPGEFTARAFFAGQLDLTRVEGVAAVIHARSDSQLRASEALLQGKLSQRTHQLREQLADLLALLEAEIDFVEEPIDFISSEQVTETVDYVLGTLEELIQHAPAVERLDILPEVALIGLPNAGKSTLLNRLTGIDRAIASATAGTTRDVVRAPLMLPHGEIILSDTAGLEAADVSESDEAMNHPTRRSQQAARRALASADLLLVVVDANDNPRTSLKKLIEQLPDRPHHVIVNKIDRLAASQRATMLDINDSAQSISLISSLTGEGCAALRNTLDALLFDQIETYASDTLALSQRQREVLAEAVDALQRARQHVEDHKEVTQGVELIALEVREATHALSLLTGEISTDDLLGRIFSNFCIGK